MLLMLAVGPLFPLALELDCTGDRPVPGAPYSFRATFEFKDKTGKTIQGEGTASASPDSVGGFIVAFFDIHKLDYRYNGSKIVLVGNGRSPIASIDYETTGYFPKTRWVINPGK